MNGCLGSRLFPAGIELLKQLRSQPCERSTIGRYLADITRLAISTNRSAAGESAKSAWLSRETWRSTVGWLSATAARVRKRRLLIAEWVTRNARLAQHTESPLTRSGFLD